MVLQGTPMPSGVRGMVHDGSQVVLPQISYTAGLCTVNLILLGLSPWEVEVSLSCVYKKQMTKS